MKRESYLKISKNLFATFLILCFLLPITSCKVSEEIIEPAKYIDVFIRYTRNSDMVIFPNGNDLATYLYFFPANNANSETATKFKPTQFPKNVFESTVFQIEIGKGYGALSRDSKLWDQQDPSSKLTGHGVEIIIADSRGLNVFIDNEGVSGTNFSPGAKDTALLFTGRERK